MILQGEGKMAIDSKVKRVQKGDMILTHPGSKNSCKNDSNKDLVVLVINVPSNMN